MDISSHSFRAVALCSLFVLYKYTLQVFPSAISHSLMSTFNMNGLMAGHLSGAFLYALIVTQVFVGYWLDRYSVVRLMACAMSMCSIGVIIFSLSGSFCVLLMARALMGVGGAFAAAGYLKVTSLVVPKQCFGFVNGLLATAMIIGIIFGKMPFALLVHYFSWRMILFGIGLLGIVLGICFTVFVPEGILQDKLSIGSQQRVNRQDIIDILKNPQNWLITFYNGLVFVPVGVFTGLWGTSFLKQAYQMDANTANLLSTCVFIGFGIGSPCIGLLADKKNSIKAIMLYSGLFSLLAVLLLVYVPYLPIWLLSILLFLTGFSAGTVVLGFVLGKALNNSRTEATLVALLNTGGVVITAMTEPLVGYLLDHHWNGEWIVEGVRYFSLSNYQDGLIVLPFYLIVALVLLCYIDEQQK